MQKAETNWTYKRALRERGITQKELSNITGIPQAYLSWFGNGRFVLTPMHRKKIARALRWKEEDLFGCPDHANVAMQN